MYPETTSHNQTADDAYWMRRAVSLAVRGEGCVEPNPMVGCVVVRDGVVLGEGYHATFGGPHAEVVALNSCKTDPNGATIYVTLEPCCHTGKTPPCTDAILAARPRRVVVATLDPFPHVSGEGVAQLRQNGIDVTVGVEEIAAQYVLAPYLMRLKNNRPWVIAKYAMTLDGKIASTTGSSRWISCAASRATVMQLRSRVDAILIGGETARRDDPLLTVRDVCGSNVRTPRRIVVGRTESVGESSRLLATACDVPLLVVAATATDAERKRLEVAGAETLLIDDGTTRLNILLTHLAKSGVTNLLVEGGGRILGSFFDENLIDEVYAFVAPKLIGGAASPTPIAGCGLTEMCNAVTFASSEWLPSGDDILFHGRTTR
ncbi:MAG: bifunctional diaminohydroxyphosphoribosylaminopyrimidine deaminase/5-amino-6-(5-phosphoribosylamino)uracil reductase RibD [Thermoguttaceae bacterium]